MLLKKMPRDFSIPGLVSSSGSRKPKHRIWCLRGFALYVPSLRTLRLFRSSVRSLSSLLKRAGAFPGKYLTRVSDTSLYRRVAAQDAPLGTSFTFLS